MGNSLKAGLLTLLLGSAGDLTSRIAWYNCSLDKPWTLLCILPPFSVISSYMYFTDQIQSGEKSCKTIFDWFVLVIPVVIIIMKFLISYADSAIVENIVPIFILVTLFTFIRFYKYKENCENDYPQITDHPIGKYISKAFLYSIATTFVISIVIFALPYLENIPVVGKIIQIIDGLEDTIPGAVTALLFVTAHLIFNILENTDGYMNSICSVASEDK